MVHNLGAGQEDHAGAGDALSIAKLPSGFPHFAFAVSRWGASNTYHSYVIYSTFPKLRQIAIIERPLNKFQANRKKGPEREVDGFYQNDVGDFLIDPLTTEGTELCTSNASQKWNVETLKLVGDRFISVDIREYNINTYAKFKRRMVFFRLTTTHAKRASKKIRISTFCL